MLFLSSSELAQNTVYGFVSCLAIQRYFWFKKKNAVWTVEHPFPRDVEYLMCDTLELLRPKLKLSTSWDEASQAADALDKEFASKLGEFLPCDVMRCTVFGIVIVSVRLCLSVCLSVRRTRGLCPHSSTYDHDFFTIW